jgi:phosphoribosylglycinamide formyltransferase-1
MPARLVVLLSGNGSNLQAILDACQKGELEASVVSVFSDKGEAYGLVRARKAGIPAFHFEKLATESRRDYDTRLAARVLDYQPDQIILVGWMRLLTSAFLGNFPRRVINLHPALPGTFPGTHAIERAYAAWQQGEIEETGVMVHLVPDEGVDDGPLLASRSILFQVGETLEQLEARVHQVEHEILVSTIKELLLSKLSNG